MSYSNIHPLDKTSLSQEDKHKLSDYEITNFSSLKVSDHFRYTSNKYRANGRKLAYGVVHNVDRENKVLEVNGYITSDQDEKYPNWNIDFNNKYKNYVVYKKVRNNTPFA
jgi:hypothetical protein